MITAANIKNAPRYWVKLKISVSNKTPKRWAKTPSNESITAASEDFVYSVTSFVAFWRRTLQRML